MNVDLPPDAQGTPMVAAFRFASRVLLAAIALVVAQRLIVPGFVAWDVPSHSDLWRYYVVAHELSLASIMRAPRPLMLLALYLLGPIDSPRVMFTLLYVPALLFVAALLGASERVSAQRVGPLAAFVLFALLFGTATFYQLNPLDYGGMLAGVFLAGLLAWLSSERDRLKVGQPGRFWCTFLVVGLLTYLSIETKPTFAALLPLTPLLLYSRYPLRRIALLCCASAGFIALSVLKDVLLKSPFIQVSGGPSPYQVTHDPLLLMKAAAFYVRGILPWQFIPLVLWLLVRTWRRNRMVAVAAVVAPVLAILPMCAIPTRLLSMYSWFGMALLGCLLVCAVRWKASNLAERLATVVLTVVAASAGLTGHLTQGNEIAWTEGNHRFNVHALTSAETLASRVHPGERLLVAGPLTPFSPYANDHFIAMLSPVPFHLAVAYPPADAPLVAMQNDSSSQVAQAAIDFTKFDRVARIDEKGRLAELSSAKDYVEMPSEKVAARFYCSSFDGISDNDLRNIKVIGCLNQVGEFLAAERIGDALGDGVTNVWIWYVRGLASEGAGHFEKAAANYARAAALENAPVFVEAEKRARSLADKKR